MAIKVIPFICAVFFMTVYSYSLADSYDDKIYKKRVEIRQLKSELEEIRSRPRAINNLRVILGNSKDSYKVKQREIREAELELEALIYRQSQYRSRQHSKDTSSNSSLESKLTGLKKLLDKKLITNDEYNKKREQLISDY